MKTLVVAEKPSVGRDIARVLGVTGRGTGCLTGKDYTVTWAVGHLVSLKEPGEVDERYRKWSMACLPMLPEKIPLKVLPATKDQFEVVKKLMNDAETEKIVCATDSGREGELIFRYIYEMAGCKKPVMRLWISSMTDAAIRAGFATMKPGSEYNALYLSARCRSEADWLVGMNASRAFSLKYNAHLSIGRVQTPTLALIVKRDREIETFVPDDYWELTADFGDYKGVWIDPEKKDTHIPSREQAEALKKKVSGKTGVVTECTREEKRTPPERLYDLTTLQREANRKYGYSADKTLKLAQSLYETHKLLTYPRTDSRYLPNDMVPKIARTMQLLPEPYASFVKAVAPIKKAERIYDDTKISDHHAIVPTDRAAKLDGLTADERNIYDMVARRLVAAHYPDQRAMATRILTDVEGERFKTNGSVTIEEGWRALYRDEKKDAKADAKELPPLQPGDTREVVKTSVKASKTKPPLPYTDDTLLKSMEDAGKTIEDEELREKMKDAGLGTPATRAAILTRLIDVGYAERKGKTLRSTEKGRTLVKVAPGEMTSAVTTGKWERALSKMARLTGEEEMNTREARFMDSIRRFSTYLVDFAVHKAPGARFPEEARPAAKKTTSQRSSGKKT